jgi:hypothetical protein
MVFRDDKRDSDCSRESFAAPFSGSWLAVSFSPMVSVGGPRQHADDKGHADAINDQAANTRAIGNQI